MNVSAFVPLAVAAMLNVIAVPELTCAIVVPAAMPTPETALPTASVAVLVSAVTLVDPLVSVPFCVPAVPLFK